MDNTTILKKPFHSIILQKNVKPNCLFWDYEFVWTKSLHGWNFLHVTMIGHGCIESKSQPYKLIRYIMYLVRPWMHCSFKGGKNVL